jgi:hypothetical protein
MSLHSVYEENALDALDRSKQCRYGEEKDALLAKAQVFATLHLAEMTHVSNQLTREVLNRESTP